MEENEYTTLDAIRDLTLTDRAFFSMIRFLDGNTRNHIVAAQLRNTSQAYQLLRTNLLRPPAPQGDTMVVNFPLGNLLDPSGNFMRNFLDPVPVIATPAQIRTGTAIVTTAPPDTTCSICQEDITGAHTRIRQCNHSFHSQCIREWFTMNTRCPVCRHDVRDLRHDNDTRNNDNRVYPDEG
jgi:hypothetical protein